MTGPDGNIWFSAAGAIGRMTMTGATTIFRATIGNNRDLAVGPDGNIWFTGTNVIGRITP